MKVNFKSSNGLNAIYLLGCIISSKTHWSYLMLLVLLISWPNIIWMKTITLKEVISLIINLKLELLLLLVKSSLLILVMFNLLRRIFLLLQFILHLPWKHTKVVTIRRHTLGFKKIIGKRKNRVASISSDFIPI